MKKAHLAYLRRAVGMAAGTGTGGVGRGAVVSAEELAVRVGSIRAAGTPVYQMIRDIVCDARFYSVMGERDFWQDYSAAFVTGFIDSLSDEDWSREELRTEKKEDFLNRWLSEHVIPFTAAEEEEIARKLRTIATGGSLMFENAASGRARHTTSEFSYGFGVKDKTDSDDPPEPDLPDEVKEILGGADDAMAGLKSEWERREREYLERMDSTLLALARRIGRSGGEEQRVSGRFQHAAKSDISGIMLGDDLNRLLPEEVAMLGSADTERLFYRRYVTKRLRVFSSASRSVRPEVRKRGAVFICLDTSSSMRGEPEMAAKNLTLCIAMIAQREGRPVCVVNYSHTLSFFMLTDLRRQRKRFLSFLSRSYAGGNDETKLFKFLFKTMPEAPVYKEYMEILKGADLLVVSDFQWNGLSRETEEMLARARGGGMRFHALGVHMGEGYARNGRGHMPGEGYRSGYEFFDDCDGCYVYGSRGKIREV